MIAMLVVVMVLICMNLYEIFEEPTIQKRIRSLRTSSQPWVTVLVYARNNEDTIKASLKAVAKSNYVGFDVVVINDRSTDNTLKRIRECDADVRTVQMTVLNRRKRISLEKTLVAGYHKSKRGEVVVTLRSGTNVPRDFLKRAVATKGSNTKVTIRLQSISNTDSLTGSIESLNKLAWHQSKKVVVSDAKNISIEKLAVRLDILSIILFLSIISVSIITQEAHIIWLGWVVVTSYVFALIWLNSEVLSTKIKLSFSAFSALFLLPVSSIIMVISQFRSRI